MKKRKEEKDGEINSMINEERGKSMMIKKTENMKTRQRKGERGF